MFYKRLEICLFSDYALGVAFAWFHGSVDGYDSAKKAAFPARRIYFWAAVLKCNTWNHRFNNDELFCEYRKMVFWFAE